MKQLKLISPFYYCDEYRIACGMCGYKGYESEFVRWGNLIRTETGVAPIIKSIDCAFCGAKEETSLGIRIQNFLLGRVGYGQIATYEIIS